LSNYLIFDKQFITYIVILYNYNSFTEIKNLRWSWPLSDMCWHFLFVFMCTSLCLMLAPACGRGASGSGERAGQHRFIVAADVLHISAAYTREAVPRISRPHSRGRKCGKN